MKIKDLRPGKEIYHVTAFADGRKGYIERCLIVNGVHLAERSGCLKIDVIRPDGHEYTRHVQQSIFLGDVGLGVNTPYNFHRLFFSRNAAEKYLARISGRSLSLEEQRLANEIMRQRVFDYYYCHY